MLLLLALACGKPATSADDTTSAGDDTQVPDTGEPGDACRAARAWQGGVESFDSGDHVAGTVSVWTSGTVSGSADVAATAGGDGAFVAQVPACVPLAVQVDADGYVSTRTYGVVVPHVGDTTERITAMSEETRAIIPSILGVAAREGAGMVVGRVTADGVPVAGRVVTVAGAGSVHYGVDDFPNRDATETSADGRFYAVNVTPGEAIDVSSADGGVVQATLVVGVVADEVSIVELSETSDPSCTPPCD